MTYQTSEPVKEIPMAASARSWRDLVHQVNDNTMSYDVLQ